MINKVLNPNTQFWFLFNNIRQSGKQAVLLESGAGSGQWSFIGVVNENVKVPQGEAALDFMEIFLQKHKRKRKRGEPPFASGFVGFLSYDLGAKWQGIKSRYSACPEAYFVYVDEVIAIRGDGRLWHGHKAGTSRGNLAAEPQSNFTRYFQKIRAIKEYLYSGDTYQVNFSQRFNAPYYGDAFEIYKKVTAINSSPYQFFLETPDFAVISNSPERLFKIWRAPSGRRFIETQPIKGTMPRGKNAREDAVNIKKLLLSEKEKAELEMIVDLERNDLGKICKPGSVKVTENRAIEKYSHVIHTVSNVRGELKDDKNWRDAIYALFPGGSVTGCPKKRTMEIIHKLEREPRGVYCGSAGYIDLSGQCDFNIMIRTLWLDKKRNKLTFRSGGGIVVDSTPEKEYEETIHKAQALMQSITAV